MTSYAKASAKSVNLVANIGSRIEYKVHQKISDHLINVSCNSLLNKFISTFKTMKDNIQLDSLDLDLDDIFGLMKLLKLR